MLYLGINCLIKKKEGIILARRKEKKENSGLKTLVIFLAILVIAFPAAAFGYIYFKLNVMHDSTADESILNETNFQSEKGV